MLTRICVVILLITTLVSNPSATPSNGVLPNVSEEITRNAGAERIRNVKDEYGPLVARFGNPDTILSTENDTGTDKPLVPSRIVRYNAANVQIALVPIGCVDAYLKAARVISEADRYPALAEDGMKQLREHPCTASAAGWTIMGYMDSRFNSVISSTQAANHLDEITVKRTLPPVEEEAPKSVVGKKKATKDAATPTRQSGRNMCQLVFDSNPTGIVDDGAVARLTRTLGLQSCKASEIATCSAALEKIVAECRRLDLFPPR